jgi:hypothetical protein
MSTRAESGVPSKVALGTAGLILSVPVDQDAPLSILA